MKYETFLFYFLSGSLYPIVSPPVKSPLFRQELKQQLKSGSTRGGKEFSSILFADVGSLRRDKFDDAKHNERNNINSEYGRNRNLKTKWATLCCCVIFENEICLVS